MKRNIKGMLGALEIAMIVVVVGILGFVGWKVLTADKTDEAVDATEINSFDECVAAGYPVMESFPEQCAVPGGETFTNDVEDITEDPQVTVTDPTITEFDEVMELDSVEDLSNLPEVVPESFINYLEQSVGPTDDGCIIRYGIEKVSQVNVAGYIDPVVAETMEGDVQACGNGSDMIWYLLANNWEGLGTTMSKTACNVLDATTIFSEFIAECYDENSADEILLANPNGSILDAVSQ